MFFDRRKYATRNGENTLHYSHGILSFVRMAPFRLFAWRLLAALHDVFSHSLLSYFRLASFHLFLCCLVICSAFCNTSFCVASFLGIVISPGVFFFFFASYCMAFFNLFPWRLFIFSFIRTTSFFSRCVFSSLSMAHFFLLTFKLFVIYFLLASTHR